MSVLIGRAGLPAQTSPAGKSKSSTAP